MAIISLTWESLKHIIGLGPLAIVYDYYGFYYCNYYYEKRSMPN